MSRGVRLGIDVGAARVGVARSDPQGTLAVPVETIHLTKSSAAKAEQSGKSGRRISDKRSGGQLVDPIERISQLVEEYEVAEIFVGHPVGLSGKKGPAAELAEEFANKLAASTPDITVRLLDERLSTVQAQQNLHSSGISTRQGRSVIDQAAAVIILQTALDAERSNGEPIGTIVGRS